jgi:hypothetical protein
MIGSLKSDLRTLGTLLHTCCEELQLATFANAMALVGRLMKKALDGATEMTGETMFSMTDRFLWELPPFIGAGPLLGYDNDR